MARKSSVPTLAPGCVDHVFAASLTSAAKRFDLGNLSSASVFSTSETDILTSAHRMANILSLEVLAGAWSLLQQASLYIARSGGRCAGLECRAGRAGRAANILSAPKTDYWDDLKKRRIQF
jgi:hypothetical protein